MVDNVQTGVSCPVCRHQTHKRVTWLVENDHLVCVRCGEIVPIEHEQLASELKVIGLHPSRSAELIGRNGGADDRIRTDTYSRLLVSLAQTLRVPVASFFEPEETRRLSSLDLEASEVREGEALLRLFLQVKNPEVRARCLAVLLRETSESSDPKPN